MRLRRLIAVGAAGLAATLGISTAAGAAFGAGQSNGVAPDSLRALAAQNGLRIGTAVIPFDLDHPDYQAVVGSQFSVVTPGNEMKWQVVEPTQGTFDWSGADRLVKFAEQHGQLVRGHVLLWHNQLPDWLTTGVANGTISNTQLRDLPPGDVRPAVRVLADAQGVPRGAPVHLVHRLGLRGRGFLGSRLLHGEGYATIYDVNLQPKPAFTDLQQDLQLAAHGAPHRIGSGAGF